jgi:hypothetical protein
MQDLAVRSSVESRATAVPTRIGSPGLSSWHSHPPFLTRYLYVPNKVKSLSEVLGNFWEILGGVQRQRL